MNFNVDNGAQAPYNETHKNVIEEFIMKHNVIFAVVLAAISFGSEAASFDCAKAGTKYEHYICNNPSISYLDEQLTAAYKDAVKIDPAQKGYQREWNKHVRNFTIDHYDLAAVESSYHHRIAALRQVAKPTDLVDSVNQAEEIKKETKAVVEVQEPVKVEEPAPEVDPKEVARKKKARETVDRMSAELADLSKFDGKKIDLFKFTDADIIGMFTKEERVALVQGFAEANDEWVEEMAYEMSKAMVETCAKDGLDCERLKQVAKTNPHAYLISMVGEDALAGMAKELETDKEKRRLMKKLRERYGHTEMSIQFGTAFDSEDVKDFLIREMKK